MSACPTHRVPFRFSVPLAAAFFSSALLLAGGCASVVEEPTSDPGGTFVSGVMRAPDGVAIAYDVRGRGDTALVFVHCWACNRSFWRHQLDRFADRYRVVSLDLPGHGASGADRDQWNIEGLAGDVETLIGALDLRRVILVGHSMGGPVSLAAARRMPNRVVGIACVDTLHNAEFEWEDGMAEQLARKLDSDFEGTMAGLIFQLFPPKAEPEVVQEVVNKATSADKDAVLALIRAFPHADQRSAFSQANVPIRCVNSQPLPPMIPPTAIGINRRYADFDANILEGVGHYPMLEKPDAFNELLDGVLFELDRSR